MEAKVGQRRGKRGRKAAEPRDRLEVLELALGQRLETRAQGDRLGAQTRGGHQAGRREIERRHARGELREAEALQAERRAPPGGDRARELVHRAARRADEQDVGRGIEAVEERAGRVEPGTRRRGLEDPYVHGASGRFAGKRETAARRRRCRCDQARLYARMHTGQASSVTSTRPCSRACLPRARARRDLRAPPPPLERRVHIVSRAPRRRRAAIAPGPSSAGCLHTNRSCPSPRVPSLVHASAVPLGAGLGRPARQSREGGVTGKVTGDAHGLRPADRARLPRS